MLVINKLFKPAGKLLLKKKIKNYDIAQTGTILTVGKKLGLSLYQMGNYPMKK